MIANRKELKWREAHAIVHGAMIGPVIYCTVTASRIASTQCFENYRVVIVLNKLIINFSWNKGCIGRVCHSTLIITDMVAQYASFSVLHGVHL